MRVERGVMIVKDGYAWGISRTGGGHGEGEESGWVPLERAKIYNPLYVKETTDVGRPCDESELKLGTLTIVERTTEVIIKNGH